MTEHQKWTWMTSKCRCCIWKLIKGKWHNWKLQSLSIDSHSMNVYLFFEIQKPFDSFGTLKLKSVHDNNDDYDDFFIWFWSVMIISCSFSDTLHWLLFVYFSRIAVLAVIYGPHNWQHTSKIVDVVNAVMEAIEQYFSLPFPLSSFAYGLFKQENKIINYKLRLIEATLLCSNLIK